MFKLRGAGTILGDSSPAIGPQAVSVLAEVDHGFNGEHMSDFKYAFGLVAGVVRHVRGSVEQGAYVRSRNMIYIALVG